MNMVEEPLIICLVHETRNLYSRLLKLLILYNADSVSFLLLSAWLAMYNFLDLFESTFFPLFRYNLSSFGRMYFETYGRYVFKISYIIFFESVCVFCSVFSVCSNVMFDLDCMLKSLLGWNIIHFIFISAES